MFKQSISVQIRLQQFRATSSPFDYKDKRYDVVILPEPGSPSTSIDWFVRSAMCSIMSAIPSSDLPTRNESP
jgi:hypothetical protein